MIKESINLKVAMAAVDQMALLQFFPADEGTRKALLLLIGQMCWNDEQVKWLAKRVISLYDQWPGPHELRAVLCSRWPAADGIDALSNHPRYCEEGFPSESRSSEFAQLSGPELKQLEADKGIPEQAAAAGMSPAEFIAKSAEANALFVEKLAKTFELPQVFDAHKRPIAHLYDKEGNPR